MAERVFTDDNPPTREQGTDRPGRAYPAAHATTGHSAVQTTDWHEIEKDRFAQRAASALEDIVRKRDAPRLVIVAAAVQEAGVAFVPGGAFFPDGGGDNTLRLSYSMPGVEDIREGIRRLATLL